MRKPKYNPSNIKWLQTAIALEKKALSDYMEYALSVQGRAGKDMFLKLARDEFHHMEMLTKELERLLGGHAWLKIRVPLSAIEETIPLIKKRGIVSADIAQSNEVQVLSLAIETEKKAMEFYLNKSYEAETKPAKLLLKRLVVMEQAHYQILQAEKDNITRTGLWMGVRERPFEVD